MNPAKLTQLALQNAGCFASLVLATDCMIASVLPPMGTAVPRPTGAQLPII
jgi:chaperonin GroEL (HSP60 family)